MINHLGVHNSVLETIGGTPLVRLRHLVGADCAEVLVKIEGGNPTGSYKDRMALAIIEGAERRGLLQPGQRIVEFSGGSTGSSLAFVCAVKGYPLSIVTSDAFAMEKHLTMRAFGADLTVVPSDAGRITADLFVRMRTELDKIVAREDAFWTDQFHNTDALLGYAALGQEMIEQTNAAGLQIDAFCASVGTAGMFAGVAAVLHKENSATRLVALEPDSSPMLAKGSSGPHRVEGIATGIIPPLLAKGPRYESRAISESASHAMAIPLARSEGIFAGTSSALNVTGALELARELGPGHTVVTVATDTGLKYLAGDLFHS